MDSFPLLQRKLKSIFPLPYLYPRQPSDKDFFTKLQLFHLAVHLCRVMWRPMGTLSCVTLEIVDKPLQPTLITLQSTVIVLLQIHQMQGE